MKHLKKWKTLNSNLVFNNPWCQIRQDEVELPNGKIINDFFINIRPDIALVFALTENQEIVFVRQYRHGVGEIFLELPAGAVEPNFESAESGAMRELTEETGYTAGNLTKIATLYDNPVKDTNKLHLFFAQNAKKSSEQVLDITEDIEVVLVPASEVMDKIAAGDICVSGSIAAIFLGLNYLRKLEQDLTL
ncbi:NUDIX hydrolase [Microcoleus sp. FACHB-68]|uniref:NUDIX hydrolase n=1 Tax=Microcoleus sp. FACHB-68 TaxID=2692826 RepID=UPI0016835525|nr:NUDIX hydrolase [Microcoleus sp. FACHB-68]MBD1939927.1 NUDIX hydrolase [Microcoleus sp. FACHB-68]